MGETARPSPVRVLKALLDPPDSSATGILYEKALFVKADVAARSVAERNCSLPFALCFYPHSRGAHSLRWLGA